MSDKPDVESQNPDPIDGSPAEPERDGAPQAEASPDPLAVAEAKAAEYWEQLLRMRAESENQRKRLERESASAVRYAAEKVFSDLLAVVDSLELGLKAAREASSVDAAVVEGLELTQRQLLSTLERHGVAVVDPQGAAFDPSQHEAMSMVPSAEAPPNHILNVVQKGYRLHDRLLRPAMVVVASAPPSADPV
jgi:molecular chaperone GrpE